ncbi:MAG: amino acid ABC transporter substrate-binding protein, partial [Gammaproteobacteria bacterium]
MKRLIVCVLCAVTFSVAAREVVRVGGYSFPPYVSRIADNRVEGISGQLLVALNQVQNQYTFRFVPTSSKRRYRDFEQGRFDLMLFESPQWGWQGKPVRASRIFLTGGEVYVARRAPARDQRFFDSLDDKRIVAILGYHYGFANFVADEEVLHSRFDILLSTSHMGSLRAVLLS